MSKSKNSLELKTIKKLIFATEIFLLTSALTFAQIKEQGIKQHRKILTKAGVLIQKEFLEIGSIKGEKIFVIYLR